MPRLPSVILMVAILRDRLPNTSNSCFITTNIFYNFFHKTIPFFYNFCYNRASINRDSICSVSRLLLRIINYVNLKNVVLCSLV